MSQQEQTAFEVVGLSFIDAIAKADFDNNKAKYHFFARLIEKYTSYSKQDVSNMTLGEISVIGQTVGSAINEVYG